MFPNNLSPLRFRHRTSVCATLLVLLMLSESFLFGTAKKYETGTLVEVALITVPFHIPDLTGRTKNDLVLPTPMIYRVWVRSGDVIYVGDCLRSNFRQEWRVNEEVQFRLKRDKLYLRRPNGKEFELTMFGQARSGPDGKPVLYPPSNQ